MILSPKVCKIQSLIFFICQILKNTNINFTSGYKQYYINIYNDYNSENDTNKTDNIVYTENRENVIISSD